MALKFEINTQRSHKTNVLVGSSLSRELTTHLSSFKSESCYLIIDEKVNDLYADRFLSLSTLFNKVIKGVVPSGEQSKNLRQFERLVDLALQSRVTRNTPVIVAGGGVTGDLGGFVAASLLRGLPLIHIPTTLLAMVDSAIGGKTGINSQHGKNLIGSFYQPELIIMDTDFLDTLPPREINCGMGEIIKYGCTFDENLFGMITGHQLSKKYYTQIVDTCARIKARVVERDELESGERAFLNFGHTFAHAIEKFTNYNRFAHGEAVFIGLVAACHLSASLGANIDPNKIISHKDAFRLNTKDLLSSVDSMVEEMSFDKKRNDKSLVFIVLDEWQKPAIRSIDDERLIRSSLSFALERTHVDLNP